MTAYFFDKHPVVEEKKKKQHLFEGKKFLALTKFINFQKQNNKDLIISIF